MSATRRLAAILAADVAGYSRLMEADEEGTLAALRAIRRELGDPKIAEYRGRIVKTSGDGLLVEFASVVDAVRCAVEVQQAMAERNAGVAPADRIEFRIGIHQGDVIVEDGDIFGDGVNLAARLEGLAEPGGICVSARVRDDVVGKVAARFDDIGEQQVKNIVRPVHVWRIGPPASSRPASETPAVPTAPLALPDKPSLAVLPFQNMSGDPEQEYFADGMVEEITTAIARLPWLFVIARNSAFTYKGRAIDVKQVARELGVRYVLEGSVRKAGNRVRIAGQLIDTTTGAHIWADRFDGALDDIFDLQDQVAASVAGAIEPKLRQSEIERASRKPPQSRDAYDFYLRALAAEHEYTESGMCEAVTLARRTIVMDPRNPPAMALIGWCRLIQRSQGWGAVSEDEVAEAVNFARGTLEAAKDDPDTLWRAAFPLSALAGEHALAASAVERSLSLNPNSAQAWMAKGYIAVFRGAPAAAIEAFATAMRLSPRDPHGYNIAGGRALAHLAAGQYDDAVEWAARALHEMPRMVLALRVKVVSHVQRSDAAAAQAALVQLRQLQPELTVSGFRAAATKNFPPGVLATYIESFRRAGLPEE